MRFTIRDLLWLMAVVGLSAGWIADRLRVGNSPGQLNTLIEVLGDQGIRVTLQSHRIQVQGSTDEGIWSYDVTIGEPIPKSPLD